MTYRIKYEYQTGNSYGTEKKTRFLELTWENFEAAKANLKRIEEHYSFWRSLKAYITDKEAQTIIKGVQGKDWYVPKDSRSMCDNESLRIKTDSGKIMQMSAPWCGFFERLLSATIELSDPDISFETEDW